MKTASAINDSLLSLNNLENNVYLIAPIARPRHREIN